MELIIFFRHLGEIKTLISGAQNFTIPDDTLKLFIELQELRDKAIHSPSPVISPSTAVDYSASALKLSKYLKDHKK